MSIVTGKLQDKFGIRVVNMIVKTIFIKYECMIARSPRKKDIDHRFDKRSHELPYIYMGIYLHVCIVSRVYK